MDIKEKFPRTLTLMSNDSKMDAARYKCGILSVVGSTDDREIPKIAQKMAENYGEGAPYLFIEKIIGTRYCIDVYIFQDQYQRMRFWRENENFVDGVIKKNVYYEAK